MVSAVHNRTQETTWT